MYLGDLPAIGTLNMSLVPSEVRRVLNSLELELQMVVSQHVGAEN